MTVNTTSFPISPNVSGTLIADNSSLFGTIGNLANLNAMIFGNIIAVAIGTSVTPTLTAAQFLAGVIDISGSPGGGVTLTTPTAVQIIGAMPPTIDKIGKFNYPIEILNDGSGQTFTLTGGTGVTILGTATVATNTNRAFMVNVNVNAGTVTVMNLGTSAL